MKRFTLLTSAMAFAISTTAIAQTAPGTSPGTTPGDPAADAASGTATMPMDSAQPPMGSTTSPMPGGGTDGTSAIPTTPAPQPSTPMPGGTSSTDNMGTTTGSGMPGTAMSPADTSATPTDAIAPKKYPPCTKKVQDYCRNPGGK